MGFNGVQNPIKKPFLPQKYHTYGNFCGKNGIFMVNIMVFLPCGKSCGKSYGKFCGKSYGNPVVTLVVNLVVNLMVNLMVISW